MKSNRTRNRRARLLHDAASSRTRWTRCAAAAVIFRKAICACTSDWAAPSSADIEIHWPSGQVDKIADAPVNKIVTIVEGKGVRA